MCECVCVCMCVCGRECVCVGVGVSACVCVGVCQNFSLGELVIHGTASQRTRSDTLKGTFTHTKEELSHSADYQLEYIMHPLHLPSLRCKWG